MEYFKNKALSNSDLKNIDPELGGSPKKFSAKTEQEETKYMEFGTLLHRYILEPENFHVNTLENYPTDNIKKILDMVYLEAEDNAFSFKPLKESEDLILEKARNIGYGSNYKDETIIKKVMQHEDYYKMKMKGKTIIGMDTEEKILMCCSSIEEHKAAKALLFAESNKRYKAYEEFEIYWKYKGRDLKSKLDKVILDTKNKLFTVIDLKSFSFPLPFFKSKFESKKIYRQLAFYVNAFKYYAKESLDMEVNFIEPKIVVIRSEPHYECEVFEVDKRYIEKGFEEIDNLLKRVDFYEKTGKLQPMEYYENPITQLKFENDV